MSSRIPPLLEPHLALSPAASLILLTSVLGASTNWLVLRFLASYLQNHSAEARDTGVVLVSFMRDGGFWREGGSKMGLDLDAAKRAGRFVFVDGLARIGALEDVKRDVRVALGEVKMARKVLVVDQVDAVLAVTGEEVTSLRVQEMLFGLQELAHSTVLTLAADHPLVAAQQTALEREHANLVLSTAHAADKVLALRMLDTGTARDVSGVVRITGGKEDAEYLYYVAADGNVRVFERGT